jgi:hypothetical protein
MPVHNNRLYLPGFTHKNDINPATGKGGIAIYSKCLGAFLKCLGIATTRQVEGVTYYVNKKSLEKWKKRHPDYNPLSHTDVSSRLHGHGVVSPANILPHPSLAVVNDLTAVLDTVSADNFKILEWQYPIKGIFLFSLEVGDRKQSEAFSFANMKTPELLKEWMQKIVNIIEVNKICRNENYDLSLTIIVEDSKNKFEVSKQEWVKCGGATVRRGPSQETCAKHLQYAKVRNILKNNNISNVDQLIQRMREW